MSGKLLEIEMDESDILIIKTKCPSTETKVWVSGTSLYQKENGTMFIARKIEYADPNLEDEPNAKRVN